MKEFEIYFYDLNEEAQTSLLKEAGITSEKEANWDVFPIATVCIEEEESEHDNDGGNENADYVNHDYLLNTGTEFDNLDPSKAYITAEEAIEAAKEITQTTGKIAEVVYMPEDDMDINEVIFRSSLELGIEDFRAGAKKESVEDRITDIIRAAAYAQFDEWKDKGIISREANLIDTLKIPVLGMKMWKHYIVDQGVPEICLDDYIGRHGILSNSENKDIFASEDAVRGSIQITAELIQELNNQVNNDQNNK